MIEKLKATIHKHLLWIIVLGGFAVIWGVNILFFADNPGFVGVPLHPYLLIVLVAACFLGYTRAMAAAGSVTVVYGACLALRLLLHIEPASRLFQFSYFSPFIGFLLIGTVAGAIADAHRKNLAAAEEKLSAAEKKIDQLRRETGVMKEKNSLLSQKCLTERELLSMLYNFAKKFSTLNLKELEEGILEILSEAVEAEKTAFYMLQGDKLVLCARRGYASADFPQPPQAILKMAIEEKRVLSVKDLAAAGKKAQNPVFVCAPVCAGQEGDVAGLVWIEEIPFLRYTPLTLRLVTLVCDWASISLANVYAFEALKKKGEERSQTLSLARVFDALTQKYRGTYEFGAPLSDIEKEIGQKIAPR
ncbi:MAG: GAF domain-containing protein [Spirochaetales bacterium]|nr:GAF domain-containing protein [Spirochaetales bacterium]